MFSLISARKSDMWLAVDPRTGNKLHSITSDGIVSATCPLTDYPGQVMHIARTGKLLIILLPCTEKAPVTKCIN